MSQPVPAEQTVRVLIVDDDPTIRDAYRSLLVSQAGYVLVGEAVNGQEAIDAYEMLQPDIVLMDLQMPVVDGIEATRAICERWPTACIVALTTFGTREYIVAALRAGAAGYLMKDVRRQNLLASMGLALDGDLPLSSSVRRALVDSLIEEEPEPRRAPDVSLTPREQEVVGWLAQGLTNQQIGAQMFVSEGSVKQYMANIADKLRVKGRTQILVKAIQLDIVNPHEQPILGEAD